MIRCLKVVVIMITALNTPKLTMGIKLEKVMAVQPAIFNSAFGPSVSVKD